MEQRTILIGILILMLIVVLIFMIVQNSGYSINGIKSRIVGDGQHGTARWADRKEIDKNFIRLKYTPKLWRNGKNLPTEYGTIVACEKTNGSVYALIDTADVHTLMIAAAGVGKTSFFLYPNIEYCCAAGMSFINTDTKGDIYRNAGYIASEKYGYDISVIDLRNPQYSDGNNILYLVSKYMQIYKADPTNTAAKAKAEKYAKITAESIITLDGEKSFGANSYFYDSAKGLISALILILAEYGEPKDCHIVSVLKLFIEFMEAVPTMSSDDDKPQPRITYFQALMQLLPAEHRAKWLAGAALNSADQAMMSSITTALSRLNAFIDSELEQVLCFDTAIDAEKFAEGKSAIFIVLPEEDKTKYVIANLIIQQLSREIYTIADAKGGKLPKRVMMYLDEFGTFPKIDGAEGLFSAARSRNISIVAIIQSMAQLQQKYGQYGAETITDNTQLALFGGFAPASNTPEIISKKLGSQTIQSGSVSSGGGTGSVVQRESRSIQMIGRQLITSDELRVMPKGEFVCMKTGMNPMKIKLRLFKEWGISYPKTLDLKKKELKNVSYASRDNIMGAIGNTGKKKKTVKKEKAPKIKELNIFDYSVIEEEDFFGEKVPQRSIRV